MALTPTVSIVGRPNVGKSTLFNRLVGKRKAIVHDMPGVTRDRITGMAEIADGRQIQVFHAVEESDLLLFLVDGRQGLTSADEAVWDKLRRTGKPVILVVNKGDTR